jgi:hypothetical protein
MIKHHTVSIGMLLVGVVLGVVGYHGWLQRSHVTQTMPVVIDAVTTHHPQTSAQLATDTARMSSMDPKAAEQTRLADISTDYRALMAFLQSLAQASITELDAHAQGMTGRGLFDPYLMISRLALIQRWAELDFDAASSHVLEHFDDWHEGLPVLARANPDATLALVDTLSANSRDDDRHVRMAIVSAVASIDPRRVIGLDALDEELLAGIAYAWGQTDPESALDWVLTQTPTMDRADAIAGLFYQWMSHEPENALPRLEDMLAAGTLSVHSQMPEMGSPLVELYVQERAKQDPLAALQWAQSQTDPAVRQEALRAVMDSGELDDAQLEQLIVDAVTPEEREHLLQTAGHKVVDVKLRRDPLDAVRWIQAQSPVMQDQLLDGAMYRWGQDNPEAAIAWASQNMPSDRAEQLHIGLSASQLYSDPDNAEAVFATMDTATQVALMPEMLGMIGPRQRRDAWLAQQPEAVADVGHTLIEIETRRHTQPYQALDLATTLPAHMRERYVMELAMECSARDPVQFSEWLQSAALSDEQRTRLEVLTDATSMGGVFGLPHRSLSYEFYERDIMLLAE